MNRTKYIRTEDNKIIVFGDLFTHTEFRKFNPISAGFISFGIGSDRNPSCSCYGQSVSLGLKSNEVEDTELAERQILNKMFF
jgi:hypothetical protein